MFIKDILVLLAKPSTVVFNQIAVLYVVNISYLRLHVSQQIKNSFHRSSRHMSNVNTKPELSVYDHAKWLFLNYGISAE